MSFPLAFKSTIDKIIKDLADSRGYDFIDLDGSYLLSDVMESQATALAWTQISLVEAPRRPLWMAEFDAGGKTSADPSQYLSMETVSLITDIFRVGSSFHVFDYSGMAMPTQRMGEVFVTSVGVSPAQFDRVAGLRLVRVTVSAIEAM